MIDKGKIVEKGRHEELLGREGVYAKLVGRQVAKMHNTLDQRRIEDGKEGVGAGADVVDDLLDEDEDEDEVKGKEDEERKEEEGAARRSKGKGRGGGEGRRRG